ncbi:hypothetical protein SLS63_000280 [Diaporthe eres]|uniref:Major facilitator superfamily (MFS) profile domain-containing protein n=1 Tax=Diaporthe eres TaxID=83184 RepID=A0ABR1PQC2_DIAER
MFHHDDEKHWGPAGPNAGVLQENHPGMYPGVYDDHDVTTQGSHDDFDDDDVGSTAPPSMRRQRTARASEDLRRTASNVLWLVIAIFVTWGYLNSFGSFQTYYEQTMPDTPPSTISWIGSLQIWLTMVGGVFTGRLLDAGFFVPTFFVGAVLQVLGMFLMSVSKTYWQLMLTQGVLTGLGGGIFFTPSLALVTTYFDKKRGLAMGLVTTGNSAGGIIYPLVVRQLIPKLGFAWTSRVLGFINLASLGVCLAFMRPRLPPRKSGPIIDWAAFREPVFDTFVAGWWLIMWANYYTFYYIASFAVEDLGMTYSAASVLIMVVNGAGLPFRVIVPLFSDRLGPLNVLLPVTLTWVIVAFCWLAVRDISGYYAFTAVYGATSGAFQCLLPTTIASITDRLDKVGTRMASGSSGQVVTCPNCGDDHPLKHCPYPNTSDGRLQACFECDTTDHPWFRCARYRNDDEALEFYLIYVARQGLCPVVHNKQLHDLWRDYFPLLDYDIQILTLQRPGPLTPRFVLRMLQDGPNDTEIERQITYEHRFLPWDLPPDALDCYQLRVKFTVLDPDTRVMSHKVVYTHMKTSKKQNIKLIGPHLFGGTVNGISILDRHNLKSPEALLRESYSDDDIPMYCEPDCSTSRRQSCMRGGCNYFLAPAEHCLTCGMENVPGPETLFTLPRWMGATLERYGLLAQLSSHWHKLIHNQWIYETADNLQLIRTNTLQRVAEQLESNPNNNDVTSFHVLELPECPECFAIETLGLGDYVQRTAPPGEDGSSHDEA